MLINDRIRQILAWRKWQDQELAAKIGMSKATISQRFAKGNWTVEELLAVSTVTEYSFSWICEGIGPELDADHLDAIEKWQSGAVIPMVNEQNSKYLNGDSVRPVTVVVNPQGKELITYVPVRAQAGYRKGYGDPHYIERLPAFSLPILKDGAYRMFEVDGDSMLQQGGGGLHDGDIVISQYVEDFFTIKDRRVYVVISTEGVVVKRCINRLKDKDNPILICQSDNKNGQHPDIIIRPHELIEVWELKAFISKQLGFATDLWDLVSKVEAQVALMNEKIKRIEEERAGSGF